MVKIAHALQKVKRTYDQIIPATVILEIAEAVRHTYRQRVLGPVETIYLFLVQILHGNTACSHLRHVTDVTCSVAAYCKARSRLPLALMRCLLSWVCQSLRDVTEEDSLWLGHRLFHLDASGQKGTG